MVPDKLPDDRAEGHRLDQEVQGETDHHLLRVRGDHSTGKQAVTTKERFAEDAVEQGDAGGGADRPPSDEQGDRDVEIAPDYAEPGAHAVPVTDRHPQETEPLTFPPALARNPGQQGLRQHPTLQPKSHQETRNVSEEIGGERRDDDQGESGTVGGEHEADHGVEYVCEGGGGWGSGGQGEGG